MAATKMLLCSGLFLLVASMLHPSDFGVRYLAGWANAGVNYDTVPNINRLGFGVGFEAWFLKMIGLEIDVFYTDKGYQGYESEGYKDHDFAEISFPLLLKTRLFFDRASTLSLSVFGGGAYSRILSEMDRDWSFKRYDLGIIAGASLEKRLGNISLVLEGRYNWGLRYLSDEYMPSRFSFKTRTLFLLAGMNVHF